MKFPTSRGVGEISGDQKKARVCYQLSIPLGVSLNTPPRQKRTREAHTHVLNIQEVAKDNDPKEKESEKHGEPHEELELVPFRVEQKSKTFRIGTKLTPIHRKEFICLVRELKEFSAWGPEDMPGVDTELSLHRLHADPSSRPIK
ncbi:hypothetical protein LIER_02461 [Lithospermum erythrorhizon]|uniref:Uncharacterized protein n=1 Tax=Lithospermum erythrorhizon TaxID=34254 RepID=A0AAV3NPI3_LITER